MTTLNNAIATTQQLVVAMHKHIHCLFMAIEVQHKDMMAVASLIEEADKTNNLEALFKIANKLEAFPKNDAVFAFEAAQLKGLTSLRTF